MSSDDDDFVEIPEEMFDEDADETVLSPVFVGHRMEAELVRSLLESSDIPAVVFGEGAYAFGADSVSLTQRVMVRSDHFEAAINAIREADITEGEIIEEVDDTDGEEFFVHDIDETEGDRDDEPAVSETRAHIEDRPIAQEYDPDQVPVLAAGSDWGPRIAGLIGVAALVTTIIVIVQKA